MVYGRQSHQNYKANTEHTRVISDERQLLFLRGGGILSGERKGGGSHSGGWRGGGVLPGARG